MSTTQAQEFSYPESPRGDLVDVLHGVEVADPYRWLEDPGSSQVREWIRAQQDVTESYLATLPARDHYRARLAELWDAPRYTAPQRHGDYYVYSRNDGLQNQSVLYFLEDLEDGEAEILLDPNLLSDDGTVSLAGTFFSPDGSHMVYALSDGGSDWRTFRVRDLAMGSDLEDELSWIKFSGASWTADGSGFFYSRYDAPEPGRELDAALEAQRIFFHRLGTSQDEDILIHERPDDPRLGLNAGVSEDGDFLIVFVRQGTDPRNEVYFAELTDERLAAGDLDIRPFLTGFDASYQPIGNDGSTFYFVTNNAAPNRRVVAIDARQPAPEYWVEIVPESESVIQGVRIVGDRLIVNRLENVQTTLTVYHLDGQVERTIELPTIGTANVADSRRDVEHVFYTFTSFIYPPTIFRYDLATGESDVFRQSEYPFDPDEYVVVQEFYESADGTRVPMFIAHRRDEVRDGTNPTYLYAYGGFNVSVTPSFSPSNIAWMERGGIYAVANIRGGGEFGSEWHDSGRLQNKQNGFDDFIAAAEHLVASGYSSPEHIGIGGGSNGGLLVGAVMSQRPELFGAAVPSVGVLDMLRFHLFTIGWAWVSDYGSPDDPEMFEVLFAYSPLHNLQEGTAYPATLILTADHDDRVVPAHSFKFAAALQHAHAGDAPALIRIEERAGHGAGTPTSMIINRHSDMWSFLEATLQPTDRGEL